MKKFAKKRFSLVELIIVIVVIAILAGMAAPKFLGVARDAKNAALINDLDVLTTVATMINAKDTDENDNFGQTEEDFDVTDYSEFEAQLEEELGGNAAALGLMNLDEAVYKQNMSKRVKTGSLSDFAVVTLGESAGTIVYPKGLTNAEGDITYGLDVIKKSVAPSEG